MRPDGVVTAVDPEPTVIEALEDWLDMAKRGELVAVGLIGVKGNGTVDTAFSNPSTWFHHLVSGVGALAYRLQL